MIVSDLLAKHFVFANLHQFDDRTVNRGARKKRWDGARDTISDAAYIEYMA